MGSYKVVTKVAKHSIGNIINDVITMYSVSGYLIIEGYYFVSYIKSNHYAVHLNLV